MANKLKDTVPFTADDLRNLVADLKKIQESNVDSCTA